MSVEEILRLLKSLTAAERLAVLQHLLALEARESSHALHEGAGSVSHETEQLEQIADKVKRLTPAQLETLGDWLENLLEDRLEMTDEFKAEIEAGLKDIAEGRVRIRKP